MEKNKKLDGQGKNSCANTIKTNDSEYKQKSRNILIKFYSSLESRGIKKTSYLIKIRIRKIINFYKILSPRKYEKELKDWYKFHTNKELDLNNPKSYNEKIQWMKLYESTEIKTKLADKYAVREWVAEQIGEEYLLPLIGVWNRFDDIDFDKLPSQFALKTNHGSGWNVIIKDKKKFDKNHIKKKFDYWMKQNYGLQEGLELHYCNIPPRIIAEKYIENIGDLYDYKFMCFNGKVEFAWVDGERQTGHARTLYDIDWKPMAVRFTYPPLSKNIEKPLKLNKMIELAEKLAKDFKHVRVDFYEIDGQIYFGEMTFTNQSGVAEIKPESFNLELGNLIKLGEKVTFIAKK